MNAKLTQSPAWKSLQKHQQQIAPLHMRDLFAADPERFAGFSLRWNNLIFDYSKNRITAETMPLLFDLAREADVKEGTDKMFRGDKINFTEKRAVLHTALRNRSNKPVMVDGEDVMPAVNKVLAHMRSFTDSVRSGSWTGCTGKAMTDVVNIGIGGSDLGPVMVTEALRPYGHERIRLHFVSNIDGTHIAETVRHLNPETTDRKSVV